MESIGRGFVPGDYNQGKESPKADKSIASELPPASKAKAEQKQPPRPLEHMPVVPGVGEKGSPPALATLNGDAKGAAQKLVDKTGPEHNIAGFVTGTLTAMILNRKE